MKLQIAGRLTQYHDLIRAAEESPDGITVTRRQKGWSNKTELDNLTRCGWLELRFSGPRGGQRWFATKAGIEAANAATIEAAERFIKDQKAKLKGAE